MIYTTAAENEHTKNTTIVLKNSVHNVVMETITCVNGLKKMYIQRNDMIHIKHKLLVTIATRGG